jgi:hypothetical protein
MASPSRSYLRSSDGKTSRDAAVPRHASFGSWTALLAATTLGVPAASTVRAEVRAATELSEGRDYRLVVQSYDPAERAAALNGHGRPIGSVQRAVTADEMKRGVQVDLMELRQTAGTSDDVARGNLAKALVLAWVEEGKPDLELDARRAKPLPGSLVGTVGREVTQDSVRISVKPSLAV